MAIGLVALLSGAASVALASSHRAAAQPRPLKVACAKKSSGLLRYVTSTSKCDRRAERAVDFAKDWPVYTCIRRDAANGIAHAASRDARGTVRRMSGPGKCGRDVQVVLPALGPRSFCVDGPTYLLRNLRGGTPCHRKGEFKLMLAKRRHHGQPSPTPTPPPGPGGNHAPVAVADAATV